MKYNGKNWRELVRLEDKELLALCRVDVYKATGRGGQKKNKTSNAIRLSLGDLQTTEGGDRSKDTNLRGALKKMRRELALDLSGVPHLRQGTGVWPPELKGYVSGGLIRINPKNPLFYDFCGCLLDLTLHHQGDLKAVAEALGTSRSQIQKFLLKESTLAERFQKLAALLAANSPT